MLERRKEGFKLGKARELVVPYRITGTHPLGSSDRASASALALSPQDVA
ncbi:MAG: hypothetical protein AB1898_07140 [Acidobacteriota bacterium]